jgi:N-acetylmuramoyl-L-alanine amidase
VQKLKAISVLLLIAGLTFGIVPAPYPTLKSAKAFTPQVLVRGSQGYDVYELQGRLRYVTYYKGPIDGKFGWETYWAVRNFQRDTGLKIDGTVGPKTKLVLVNHSRGYHTGMYKTATTDTARTPAASRRATGAKAPKPTYGVGTYSGKLSAYDINLLEHTVYAEARGEPFIGQVAVAACVLNRLSSPLFPKTIAGIVFQPGAFTSVADGQFYLQPDATAHRAVMDAVQGWDPSGGALYYFNPATATSKWIWSRPQIKKIGKHIFTH